MRRLVTLLLVTVVALPAAGTARADFGFSSADVVFRNDDGTIATQAGTHPFEMSTSLAFNTRPNTELGFEVPDEDPKRIVVTQMPGFIGDPTAVPPCSTADFAASVCPISSQVGVVDIEYQEPGFIESEGVYSVVPSPGSVAVLGWHVSAANLPVTVDVRVDQSPPHNVIATLTNVPNVVPVYESIVTLWGVPAASSHDKERIGAGCEVDGCPVGIPKRPFLTTPRSCMGPLPTAFKGTSWEGSTDTIIAYTHDEGEPPQPKGMTGCGALPFKPSLSAQPTSSAASSPTGMDVNLTVDDEGLTDSGALAQSDIKETVVTLPEGMTANPSLAAGLQGCTEAQLASETPTSVPGAGCPEASKIGSVEVETPLLDQTLKGSLFQATPFANLTDDALIGLYIVIKNSDLGIVVKQPLRVDVDPKTGRVTGTAEDIPQIPFSRFRVHFREGPRAPLVMPSTCGEHTLSAKLVPWAGGPARIATSSFQVTSGPENAPCPAPGQVSGFAPSFVAGTENNQASAFAPFSLRILRKDGEQEITRIAAALPPGLTGKIAGLTECSQGAVEAAKAKSGLAELSTPSCPASSRIGSLLSGAGAGPDLTYVGGSLYLGGAYAGNPLSLVAVVPAVAGPFDLGTVVVQVALTLNPVTYRVEADGAASDPIPHILEGIPLRLRDLRIQVDRPNFTINPTSCEPLTTGARIFGSFQNIFSPADDVPVAVASRFQAANCSDLGFNPKLKLQLKGPTTRAKHVQLRSTVTYPYPSGSGYANISKATVVLPPSQIVDPERINNPCTRDEFAADDCPASSVLGRVRATTPLLDEPLEGLVYFRSNGGAREIPDIVADIRGKFRVTLVGFVDTITPNTNPRIRARFTELPDAPVTKFSLNFFGGKRGLLVNSKNLCTKKQISKTTFVGQNGRLRKADLEVKTNCGGKNGKRSRR